ncbi:CoA ester lyase [Nocardia sp. XZ_19_369]|uniref:HpcH/HpaI aldolase/citrate lyase family protein n=1 Tax=Nocardia sp. XZ_19_369 TaxID=2769487 RepID=UPI00188E3AFC|nr:CoA ester lyase [Nocardia sp. XZ_19_369]
MKYTRYCRSFLSTPALAEGRYSSGHQAGADMCVVDLEDSVPPWDKEQARYQAEKFFAAPTASATRCGVRINAVTEPDGLRDLLAIQEYVVKPAVVVIPKVESARDVEIVAKVLGPVCPDLELFAVVETPRGLENVASIAAGSRRLRALIFGAADYSFEVGARLSWDYLVHARGCVVNAARAAEIEVVDAPVFDINDIGGLREESARAQALGFSGKIAIHPRQIPVINEVFSPDAGTLEKAKRIVSAGLSTNRRIAVVDGVMMGLPFFEASRRLVEDFGNANESAVPATFEER